MIKFTSVVFIILCTTTNLAFGFTNRLGLHKLESSGKSDIIYPSQVFNYGRRAHLDNLLDKGIRVVLEKLY